MSSGLVSLPVDFVYYDGNVTTERTTKILPTGHKLNGKESYNRIVSHFTTTTNSAEEINTKGKEQMDIFYDEVKYFTISSPGTFTRGWGKTVNSMWITGTITAKQKVRQKVPGLYAVCR